ncbi:exodeoxyribonuclease VII small subunit [Lebetimonas natsushimae]|jgi:exodeoxyribonuclease VII small subunit|uniref:Exodeoxyribonuclease VII small subunit n=1 Tax=Lebetimonas natsushimae TaxID=1936991 RepID=A0A292YB34_9BACT|nr:exodeoxyribonuclease VII small subunit [Lebetimonas natsushimae]GAX88172.1 exodeoxyribonuclease VII small subunit [Lebetimonas natsushimae]
MEDFEKKLKEAKELLEKLNDPEITLFQAMEYYKKGVKLLEEASKMIEEAKLQFKELTK